MHDDKSWRADALKRVGWRDHIYESSKRKNDRGSSSNLICKLSTSTIYLSAFLNIQSKSSAENLSLKRACWIYESCNWNVWHAFEVDLRIIYYDFLKVWFSIALSQKWIITHKFMIDIDIFCRSFRTFNLKNWLLFI